MHEVLEFPSKIFAQWGAIAQEIGPYLAQRGARQEEICAVIERLRTRWEQREAVPSGGCTGVEFSDGAEEHDIYGSRHWRSQSARSLIASAMADYQRHAHC